MSELTQQEIHEAIEAAREREGWFTEDNMVYEPYTDVGGVGRNHTIAVSKRPDDGKFVANAPRVIAHLAAENAALRDRARWRSVAEEMPPVIVPSYEDPPSNAWILCCTPGIRSSVTTAYIRHYASGVMKWVTPNGVGSKVESYHAWQPLPASPQQPREGAG